MAAAARTRASTAVRAYAPHLADRELVPLGRGLDHAAYAAGDLVLRVADDGGVGREARLLEVVAGHVSLPVPDVRFADDETGVLAYRRLPGRPLLGRPAPAGAAPRLGRFLRELHGMDRAAVAELLPTDDADPAAWLEELDGPPELLAVLRASVPPAAPDRVVAHADLGAEHILELGGEITGVIDWSDAAITDPALDLARPYRDFGPAFLEELTGVYGRLPEATLARVEFFARCAALEDLAYGRATGRRAYAVAAERSLRWLFRD